MRAIVAVLLVFVAGIALAACGGAADEAAAPPAAPTTTTEESQPLVPDREKAPVIQGESLDGQAISLGDFRGRPVLVNVWSSW